MPHPLPQGEPVLSPYLVVTDPAALIAFLETVFGAKEVMRIHRPDGSVMHAQVRIGDSSVMMGGATPKSAPKTAMLHVYVEDADATYAKALETGGETIMPPAALGDGDKRGGFTDPCGNQWWVGERIETLSPEEIEKRLAEHSTV